MPTKRKRAIIIISFGKGNAWPLIIRRGINATGDHIVFLLNYSDSENTVNGFFSDTDSPFYN